MTELDESDLQEMRERPSYFVEKVVGVTPFDYQKDVLDAKSDRVAFVSGRQVGKSRTASWIALHRVLTRGDITVLITSPSQRQSSELFNQVRKEMHNSEIPDEMWGKTRETRTVIEFKNDSRIICLPTGDDGSTIRGYTADLIIVDEAAFIDDTVFYQALLPMMAVTDGKMVLLSTPYGSNGFLYDAFYNDLEQDWYSKQVATYENPLVSSEFIAEQQNQLSSIDFKQEILGKFVESSNSFFETETIENTTEETVTKLSERVFLGVDPARHGSDWSVFTLMDAEGNVFKVERQEEGSLVETIGRIQALHESFQFDRICIDETALGGGVVDVLRQDMRRNVVQGVNFTIKTKQTMYNTLKNHLENGDIILPEDDKLQKQLLDLEYEFTTGGKMKIHAPSGGKDDHADSLALACWAREQGDRTRQTGTASF